VIRDVRLSGEELAKRLGLARDVVLIARLQPAGRVLKGLKELGELWTWLDESQLSVPFSCA
jgi:hypothetical protein